MQWLGAFVVATCGALAAGPAGAAGLPEPPLAGPVEVAPLASMRLTGGFGETRSNHFHAGLDLSTGGVVGAAVRAPLAGAVERVRASGIGYGRSLYLRARDGRLFVFGHLDAFAPEVAAWVDSVQRASGQYEQDLWPPVGRFAYAAGDTVAWSGESGAGPPHLHVEVRHGDFALAPLRAGLRVAGEQPPVIARVVLEPVSLDARIAGRPSPLALRGAGVPETLAVVGTLRAVIEAHSGLAGAGDVPPWSTAIEWNGARTEARLDSISWAGEMSQLDWVVDRGRVVGGGGLIVYAPAGERPRFIRGDAPLTESAGEIRVASGDPPRPLRVVVTDANGASVTRTVWLRGDGGAAAGAASAPAAAAADARADAREQLLREPRWEFFPLPGGDAMRVRVTNVPAGLARARFEREREPGGTVAAVREGAAWTAIVPTVRVPDDDGMTFVGQFADSAEWRRRGDFVFWRTGTDLLLAPAPFAQLSLTRDVVYERGVLATRVRPAAAGPGLAAITPVVQVLPARLPLRKAAPIALRLSEADSIARVGLYRRTAGGEWEYVRGQEWDARARLVRAEASALGEFALLRDVSAPRVSVARPPRRAARGPYSRWALVARVSESGSGLDASRSRFVVDGRVVPSEWDPEQRELRWRPLAPPAPGRHTYEVVVTDRAGLAAKSRGSFVLDSAAR